MVEYSPFKGRVASSNLVAGTKNYEETLAEINGDVAQLNRAIDYGSIGRGFDSYHPHKSRNYFIGERERVQIVCPSGMFRFDS